MCLGVELVLLQRSVVELKILLSKVLPGSIKIKSAIFYEICNKENGIVKLTNPELPKPQCNGNQLAHVPNTVSVGLDNSLT